jgi:uncharacterized protein (DUF1778 family)
MPAAAQKKSSSIQIRASAETKALIAQAAGLRGQTLSDFVLMSARRAAEDAILDQRIFLLDDEQHEKLLAILDNPPPLSDEVRRRFERKPPWVE